MARPETNEKVKKKKKEKWSEERKMEAKLKRENSEAQPANNPPKKRAKKHERKREKLSKKKKSDPNHVHQSGTYVTIFHSFLFREFFKRLISGSFTFFGRNKDSSPQN